MCYVLFPPITLYALLPRPTAPPALAATLPSLGSTDISRPPVRLAVIGPGKRGMNLMRGAFLRDGFQVVAVCDVDANRLAAAKELADARQPNTDCYATTRHEDAMDRADVDAVVIATPDHWHAPMALAALKAKKDVSLEKPITRTIAEGRTLSDAARDLQRVFRVDSELRSRPSVQRAAEPVGVGGLGVCTRGIW